MKRSVLWVYFAFVVVALLTYFNALNSSFIGDDIAEIINQKENFKLGLVHTLQEVFPDRPILILTIWLNYFFGELNPFGFKLVNVLIHAFCGSVLYQLLKILLKENHFYKEVSFFSALLFIVHPINNQAINSVIQRGVLLSAFFGLLALLFYFKPYSNDLTEDQNTRKYYLFSILFFLLSVFAKPNVISIPLVILLISVIVYNQKIKNILIRLTPFILISSLPPMVYLVFKLHTQSSQLFDINYFQIQSEIIFEYFRRYLIPVGLSFYYPIESQPLSDQLSSLQWVYWAFHLIFIAASFFGAYRKKSILGLMILLTYIFLLPESSVFKILHLAFDHRNYLSIGFFAAALVFTVFKIFSLLKKQNLVPKMLLVAIGLILALLNINYNYQINTFSKWASYNIKKNPADVSFIDYILVQALRENNYAEFKSNLDYAAEKNPNDLTYRLIQEVFPILEKQTSLSDAENLKLYVILSNKNFRIIFTSFFDFVLFEKLSKSLNEKDLIYKMNSYYMNNINLVDVLTIFDNQYKNRFKINLVKVLSINQINDQNLISKINSMNKEDFIRSISAVILLEKIFNVKLMDLNSLEKIVSDRVSQSQDYEFLLDWIRRSQF